MALQRMIDYLETSNAAMAYADRYQIKEGRREAHPVCDYQMGSVRDDFDFGPLVLVRTDAILRCDLGGNWLYGGWYDLRLQHTSGVVALLHVDSYP